MLLRVHAQCTSPLETHSNQRTTCARSVCGWFAILTSCHAPQCPVRPTLYILDQTDESPQNVFSANSPSSDSMSSALVATGLPSTVDACSRVQRDRSFTQWDTLLRAMERVLVTGVTRDQSSRRVHRMWPCSSKPVVCPASSQTSNDDSLPFGRSTLDWRMRGMLRLAPPGRTTLSKRFLWLGDVQCVLSFLVVVGLF